ncbi:MAG: hypothetical protein AMXMBFR13_19240 [Phycisphaerae bacterium]
MLEQGPVAEITALLTRLRETAVVVASTAVAHESWAPHTPGRSVYGLWWDRLYSRGGRKRCYALIRWRRSELSTTEMLLNIMAAAA